MLAENLIRCGLAALAGLLAGTGSLGQPTSALRQSFRDPSAVALKAAVTHSDLEAVRKLLEAAGTNDCLELDEQGRTALHFAVQKCALERADPKPFQILKLLAERPGCVNAPDRIGRKPILELAPLSWADRSKMDALNILIAHGADVNAQDETGATLLHQLLRSWDASSAHLPEVLEVLIQGGLKPNMTNAAGESALHSFFGPAGFVANGGGDRSTKVVAAQKIFSLLTAAGADPALKNNEGTTPLGELFNCAEPYFGSKDTILAFAGPVLSNQLNLKAALIKNRPVLIALCDKSQADADWVARLLGLGADAKAAEADGFTALHGAAWFYNVAVCELLLSRGADPNAANDKGRAPLHELARSKYLDSAYLDSDRDADPLKTADLLIARGADRRRKDQAGKTPVDLLKDRAAADPDRLGILRGLRKKLKP